jgi:hypothetical protein
MMPTFVKKTLQAQSGLTHGTKQETRADWRSERDPQDKEERSSSQKGGRFA